MLIYIAGPYEGRLFATPMYYAKAGPEFRRVFIAQNVKKALQVADSVIRLGCVPFVPHLWHEMSKQFYHTRQAWLELGLRALEHCQAVIRIPGVSEGVAQEVQRAQTLHIPVFSSEDLLPFADFVRKQKGDARDQRHKQFIQDLQAIPLIPRKLSIPMEENCE